MLKYLIIVSVLYNFSLKHGGNNLRISRRIFYSDNRLSQLVVEHAFCHLQNTGYLMSEINLNLTPAIAAKQVDCGNLIGQSLNNKLQELTINFTNQELLQYSSRVHLALSYTSQHEEEIKVATLLLIQAIEQELKKLWKTII